MILNLFAPIFFFIDIAFLLGVIAAIMKFYKLDIEKMIVYLFNFVEYDEMSKI